MGYDLMFVVGFFFNDCFSGRGAGGRKDLVNRWCRDKVCEREGCGGVDRVFLVTYFFIFMYFVILLILVFYFIVVLVL